MAQGPSGDWIFATKGSGSCRSFPICGASEVCVCKDGFARDAKGTCAEVAPPPPPVLRISVQEQEHWTVADVRVFSDSACRVPAWSAWTELRGSCPLPSFLASRAIVVANAPGKFAREEFAAHSCRAKCDAATPPAPPSSASIGQRAQSN